MRTLIKMKLIPGFLTTTLFALACEKPPNPAAPKRAQFSMQDDNNSRITGGGKLDGGRDFATFGLNARPDQGHIEWVQHCLGGARSSRIRLRPTARSTSPRKRVTPASRAAGGTLSVSTWSAMAMRTIGKAL